MSDQTIRTKGVADIVFVLDCSGTMSDIIDALKSQVFSFVDMLLNDVQSTVRDVRLGLVTHDVRGQAAVHSVDFMTSAEDFQRALDNAPDGVDEYGLPAIDRALDFPWRSNCRRYIVFFSDECVLGGQNPDFQNSLLRDLGSKMAALHVHFIAFNEEQCPSYELLGKTPGSSFTIVSREELLGTNMSEVLAGIAKTVSQGVDSNTFSNVEKNLYNL